MLWFHFQISVYKSIRKIQLNWKLTSTKPVWLCKFLLKMVAAKWDGRWLAGRVFRVFRVFRVPGYVRSLSYAASSSAALLLCLLLRSFSRTLTFLSTKVAARIPAASFASFRRQSTATSCDSWFRGELSNDRRDELRETLPWFLTTIAQYSLYSYFPPIRSGWLLQQVPDTIERPHFSHGISSTLFIRRVSLGYATY